MSSFTISDGVFGSCFYFATGFHGLAEAPINLIMRNSFLNIHYAKKFSSLAVTADGNLDNSKKKDALIIKFNNKTYYLDQDFIE